MIVEPFAGPGGWDEGALHLGARPLGIEYGRDVCATRARAGHLTVRADVRTLATDRFDDVDGVIASPPCPVFSNAGHRHGRSALDVVLDALDARLAGDDVLEDHRQAIEAKTFGRLLEAKLEAGQVVALDATPHLQARAHRTALEALLTTEPLRWVRDCRPRWVALEQVRDVLPVWRRMATLLERLGYSTWAGVLEAERYGVAQTRERAILMAHLERPAQPPEPTHERYVPRQRAGHHPELFALKPWVSMGEALGWDVEDGALVRLRPGGGGYVSVNRRDYTLDEPAPTIAFGHDEALWQWVFERPATTVAGDPRIAQPGHKRDADNPDSPGRMEGAVSVTLDEALVLQSFRADYPIVGGKRSAYQQVGNAVPPLLAEAILGALI